MPTELIQKGVATALVQDTIYALPANAVYVRSTAAVEVSLVVETTGFTVLANSTTGTTTAAAFVRCTSGATTILCKAV